MRLLTAGSLVRVQLEEPEESHPKGWLFVLPAAFDQFESIHQDGLFFFSNLYCPYQMFFLTLFKIFNRKLRLIECQDGQDQAAQHLEVKCIDMLCLKIWEEKQS